MHLIKPPDILCVHINRVAYSPMGVEILNSARVRYPSVFSLDEVMPNKVLNESSGGESSYRLAAMVEHVGVTPHSGHYLAYKRLFAESIDS